MKSVLFVCTANICRSAYAELVAASRLSGRLDVSSAGTHGWSDHPVEEEMAAQLVARGIDPSGFRSRPLTRDMVDAADLVLTAGTTHRRFVLEERPAAVRRTFTLGQFAAGLAEVPQETGANLLEAVRRARATPRVDDDVADPFRRGPVAAERAAEHLDALLERILPRLAP